MLEHDAWGAHRWRGLPQPTPSESFKKVASAWNEIDTAIVNIGNYPSSPDYATATRFGVLLTMHKAMGRMLCSYFDIHGAIIHSDTDYAFSAAGQFR